MDNFGGAGLLAAEEVDDLERAGARSVPEETAVGAVDENEHDALGNGGGGSDRFSFWL